MRKAHGGVALDVVVGGAAVPACEPADRWPLQKRIPGTLRVEMERPGGESRWNTLRALRVLRRCDA